MTVTVIGPLEKYFKAIFYEFLELLGGVRDVVIALNTKQQVIAGHNIILSGETLAGFVETLAGCDGPLTVH